MTKPFDGPKGFYRPLWEMLKRAPTEKDLELSNRIINHLLAKYKDPYKLIEATRTLAEEVMEEIEARRRKEDARRRAKEVRRIRNKHIETIKKCGLMMRDITVEDLVSMRTSDLRRLAVDADYELSYEAAADLYYTVVRGHSRWQTVAFGHDIAPTLCWVRTHERRV